MAEPCSAGGLLSTPPHIHGWGGLQAWSPARVMLGRGIRTDCSSGGTSACPAAMASSAALEAALEAARAERLPAAFEQSVMKAPSRPRAWKKLVNCPAQRAPLGVLKSTVLM